MINSETPSLTQTGTVEVSGWDEDEVFFVERSKLDWDEYAGKHVTLTRMLSEGYIIFVRPIQPTALYRANPIPYEAEFLAATRRHAAGKPIVRARARRVYGGDGHAAGIVRVRKRRHRVSG
jgi:hypothetical protein